MKKLLLKTFHFLGSIYFAIVLIATTALLVTIGTFIESAHDSHLQASRMIYNNPLFLALLCGFFINILLSALRRYPFKKRHIPFLITHFGMLMIISGTVVKHLIGVQGVMLLMEGATSDTVLLSDTQALYMERRDPKNPYERITQTIPVAQLPNAIVTPHCCTKIETWFQDDHAHISGLPSLQIADHPPYSPAAKVKVHSHTSDPWDLYAVRTRDVAKTARDLYLEGLTLTLRNPYSKEVIWEGPLTEISYLQADLDWNFSLDTGFDHPKLALYSDDHRQEVHIPLNGDFSADNINIATPYLGSALFTADIRRDPCIVMIQDCEDDSYLFTFDAHGRVDGKHYPIKDRSSIIVYDEGFGGYSVQYEVPFPDYDTSRETIRCARIHHLGKQLRQGLETDPSLSPPLQILAEAASKEGSDPVEVILTFLDAWERSGHWLFPSNYPFPSSLVSVFEELDWKALPDNHQSVCAFLSELFYRLEPELCNGESPLTVLENHQWPFLEVLIDLQESQPKQILNALTEQAVATAEHLELPFNDSPLVLGQKARLLTAYLRACNVHLSDILPKADRDLITAYVQEAQYASSLHAPTPHIEATLHQSIEDLPPLVKLEDNIPHLALTLGKDHVDLAFDPLGQGLKWPILNGAYLVRFQPKTHHLPYKVKLHQAKQINYPGTSQAYSYECAIRFTDTRTGKVENSIISMNNVHETIEGYRFYLSNIASTGEGSVKRVQIVVNYDPAKYLLTYPGGAVMALGIVLLFWSRRQRKT